MSHLLDSDVLIYYYDKQEPWRTLVRELLAQEEIFISIVSVMEICAGWSEQQRRLYLPELYELFEIIPVTTAIAERAGILRYDGKHKEKRKPTPMDALIAATAIEHDYRLVTNNRRDFSMPQLKLYRELWQD